MGTALVLRLFSFLATLSGVVGLVLLLLDFAPGDPIDLLPNADLVREQLQREWNLDKPLFLRYFLYLSRVLQGDLGTSIAYRPGTSVLDIIYKPALWSLVRLWLAITLAMTWGTLLAWLTASRHWKIKGVLQIISIAPVFLLAHLLIYSFNESAWILINQKVIERPSWFALPDEASLLRSSLAIGILAVGSGTLAEVHRETEQALTRILQSGYVEAARSRGSPLWPHIFWNLLLPLTTIASSRTAFLAGELVILEKVFLLNGLGAIFWQAALLRDYDLALGISLILAALVCGVRFLGDVVRLALDPRRRMP